MVSEDAERNLVPRLRLVAKIGDREVAATATFDGKPFTSPWVWDKNVKSGSRIPSADVTVEYIENGKLYVGTMKPVTVDWNGPRIIAVALAEYKGAGCAERKLPGGERLGWMRGEGVRKPIPGTLGAFDRTQNNLVKYAGT